MRVETKIFLLCLLFLLWGGCSKEEEPLPPVQITKVRKPIIWRIRKPIIRPAPEKVQVSSFPQPEESEPEVKRGGEEQAKSEKEQGGQERAEPQKKKDRGKEARRPKVEKKGSIKGQEAAPTSGETQLASQRGPFKELEKIRFVTTPDGEEKVLIWLNVKFQPRIFPLEGDRPRVVCDFLGARLGSAIGRAIKAGGRIIKEIRIGSYRGPNPKVRVVLDLVNRESGDYEIQPIFYEDEKIYALVAK